MGRSYLGSDAILEGLQQYESSRPAGLNGAIILVHAGTDPRRKDKFYDHLDSLLAWLGSKGYRCEAISKLLSN
jgi:hypothetical protein